MDQASELRLMKERQVDHSRSFVRFQQISQGVPVMGGEIIVQLDPRGNVLSANGEALPSPAVDVTPKVAAESARQRALEKVAGIYSVDASTLVSSQPELWIFNQALLGGKGPRVTSLVWRMDVTSSELEPIRELILIEAHLGFVALHFNQVDTAKNRIIYDNNNNPLLGLPGSGPVRTEGGPPSGVTDVNKAYDYAGVTYDFYFNTHGRDSIDNAGLNLISTVRYCPNVSNCPYQNAFWNGTQMVYGDGFASADDVVAHELTHGVTENESHLFYYYQSGAINEALSDIWGEIIDLTNVESGDTPGNRWLMGEDLSIGAIRSMSDPTIFGDPDKMTSAFYTCDPSETDGGGVHTNSGVANKAAYLMVDGATFNGKTVTGMGLTKTAKIWYEAQTNLISSASDYNDLYDALQQACTNLIGTSGITAGDCNEVKDAVDAVEMNLQPTSCSAPEAPLCDFGTPVYLFNDNLENTISGNWTSSATSGANEWYYPQNTNPYSFDATYATSGIYNFWGYGQPGAADYNIRMTADVSLPGTGTAYLHFDHAFGFDDNLSTYYDGGMVEYSTSGGSSWTDAASLITQNGYNGTIALGQGNPLQGRQAFVAESNGYISSRLNLSSLAGQNVRFRFRIGTSSSVDDYGWFIDDIRIYTCSTTGLHFNFLPAITWTEPPGVVTTILNEGFEGAFPGVWDVSDNNGATGGQYQWGNRNCHPYAGSFSAWAVGDRIGAADPSCGSNYPNDTDSWMVYGPFSLSGADTADMSYKLWLNAETGFDYLCHMASLNGVNFYGTCYWGNSAGWVDNDFDLTSVYTLGDITGQANVWVVFIFQSDDSVSYPEGALVDNVLLQKCSGNCTTTIASSLAGIPTRLNSLPASFELKK
jgi:Zn-dependent metalloprotease